MPSAPIRFWDYVKAAFRASPRLPALGNVPLNYLGLAAFGVLGLLNPGFWFLGAGLELAYLMTIASNVRFQKVVQGRALLQERRAWDARKLELLGRLDAEDRRRYAALEARCRAAVDACAPLGGGTEPAAPLGARDFEPILGVSLRLLLARAWLRRDAGNPELRRDLEAQRDRAANRLQDPGLDATLRRTLESTHGLLARRIEILETAGKRLRQIDAELERVEQQVALIGQETASALRNPDVLSTHVDAIAQGLEETSRWLKDLQGPLAGSETALDRLPEPPPRAAESEKA